MKYFFFVFLIIAFTLCKKKNEHIAQDQTSSTQSSNSSIVASVLDTVKPGSYFPAFPGSYWKYISSASTDTIRCKTSISYFKDSYKDRDVYSGALLRSDSAYVTAYYDPDHDSITVWGVYAHTGPIYGGHSSLLPLVSDTFAVGFQWETHFANHISNSSIVQKKDTSIMISGQTYSPTIVIYDISYSELNSNTIYPIRRKYYTRDIGLVKQENLDPINGSVQSEMHIVAYHINH